MIHQAKTKDIPAIVEMTKAFADDAGVTARFGFNPQDFSRYVATLIDSSFWLVLVDNNHKGFFIGGVAPFCVTPTKKVLSEHIWWVQPEARKTGLGLALLETAIKLAKDAGVDYVTCGHLSNYKNKELNCLYQRLGFKPLETTYIKEII